MTGKLYIVGTPIGNLGDITLRALETLKEVDLVACEDTRVTAKLLTRYEIKKSLVSIHQHSKVSKLDKVVQELENGKNVALVTDAGTPGISDPGNQLVAEAIKNNIEVTPIPGVSALTTILSVAGIDTQKFIFLGFPPHKKGRVTFFKEVLQSKIPVVFFESTHRIIKNLELLAVIASEAKQSLDKKNKIATSSSTSRNDIRVIIGKELTKMFEEVIRGNIQEALEYLKNDPAKQKGEFVIIVY